MAAMFSETDAAPAPVVDTAEGGLRLLRKVVDSDLLRCGLPAALGGNGGTLIDLAQAAARLAERSAASGHILWAQRMAIEAIAGSTNIGLREYLLPDLLSGERAASMPLSARPLTGHDTGRGWRLDGQLDRVPNWQWMGCSIVTPVLLGTAPGWVVLRSEEDGLRIGACAQAAPPLSRSVSVHCAGVFFREDEWLGGPELAERLAPLAQALASALRGG